ncbi:hypothetical protein [Actinoplanes regularis]|uniref:hypothetical protein n=1 Tax=Actinoplanes regularis TaxID=52697 RepID=UPI0024A488D6|nr:hypothetical protein [Actinoplanes regularis]GLW34385.1 hypothetical protein Areg01_73220 [Actinoplanes regularis]
MRQVYVHHATLVLEPGADPRAPGGAITVALCGSWEHEPPCPLAAHHTAAEPDGSLLRLRILFATAPDRVDEVRGRIDAALCAGPWQLIESGCARIAPEERPHARRLLRSGTRPPGAP